MLVTLISLIWLSATAAVSSTCFLTSLTRQSWCITQVCHPFLSLRSAHEWPVKSMNKGHKLAFLSGSLLFPAPVVVDSAVRVGLLAQPSVRTPLVTWPDPWHKPLTETIDSLISGRTDFSTSYHRREELSTYRLKVAEGKWVMWVFCWVLFPPRSCLTRPDFSCPSSAALWPFHTHFWWVMRTETSLFYKLSVALFPFLFFPPPVWFDLCVCVFALPPHWACLCVCVHRKA